MIVNNEDVWERFCQYISSQLCGMMAKFSGNLVLVIFERSMRSVHEASLFTIHST